MYACMYMYMYMYMYAYIYIYIYRTLPRPRLPHVGGGAPRASHGDVRPLTPTHIYIYI